MKNLQNWSSVVQRVQNANLDQQRMQYLVKSINKRAYKQQLDRQVQFKQYENALKSAAKLKQLQEARVLAEAQKQAKRRQKQQNAELHKAYCNQNQSLVNLQNNLKSIMKTQQIQNLQIFKEHPFVRLVDGQDDRLEQLRKKLKRQNEINYLQEEMKNKQKQERRYLEKLQKNNFVDHVEMTHVKRSQERDRFKNKYLRIKRGEIGKEGNQEILQQNDQPVEKMYINYLNNQISQNKFRKMREKEQFFDDRMSKFYSSNKLEPDSSPAFLGRTPLSHQRRRQLYYINKHLNIHHEKSDSSNFMTGSLSIQQPGLIDKNRFSQFNLVASRLNPEQQKPDSKLNQGMKCSPNYTNRKDNLRQKTLAGLETELLTNFESNRRLKSQLNQYTPRNDNRLPEICKHPVSKTPFLSQSRQQALSTRRTQKKQFFRFDPITGKQNSLVL